MDTLGVAHDGARLEHPNAFSPMLLLVAVNMRHTLRGGE